MANTTTTANAFCPVCERAADDCLCADVLQRRIDFLRAAGVRVLEAPWDHDADCPCYLLTGNVCSCTNANLSDSGPAGHIR